MTDAPARRSERIHTVDALRGVAAILVVLFHLYGAVSRTASDWLWAPVEWTARHGALGVDIFFVLSGFVIALSVHRGAPTFSYLGRFVLRRSIRLDPPYWTAIALEVTLLLLTVRFFPGMAVTLPTVPQLVSHLFYIQNFLGYEHVVNVFWTLTYEIQFYVFFVTLGLAYARLPGVVRRSWLPAIGATALFLLSLWVRLHPTGLFHGGLALSRWFQFYLGVLTWRAVTWKEWKPALIAGWLAVPAMLLVLGGEENNLLGVGVSVLLFVTVGKPTWERLAAWRPIAFLGTISYSLYLYHSSVGWRFVGLVQRLLPGPWSSPVAVGVYLLGVGISIGVAAALWWLVERPCLAFSRRVRLPLRIDPAAAAPAPVPVVSPQLVKTPHLPAHRPE